VELFGPDWKSALAQGDVDPDFDERSYGSLSQEKREKIRAMSDHYAEAQAEIYLRMVSGELTPEDKKKMQELKQQERQELVGILTPAELEDYDLRNSNTAQNLRAALINLDLSKDDFLAVYRLQKAFDDQYADTAGGKDTAKQRNQAQKQLESQIRSTLGEQRYAEYRRAQDPDYQELFQLTKNYN